MALGALRGSLCPVGSEADPTVIMAARNTGPLPPWRPTLLRRPSLLICNRYSDGANLARSLEKSTPRGSHRLDHSGRFQPQVWTGSAQGASE
jgi:hypothetical protein